MNSSNVQPVVFPPPQPIGYAPATNLYNGLNPFEVPTLNIQTNSVNSNSQPPSRSVFQSPPTHLSDRSNLYPPQNSYTTPLQNNNVFVFGQPQDTTPPPPSIPYHKKKERIEQKRRVQKMKRDRHLQAKQQGTGFYDLTLPAVETPLQSLLQMGFTEEQSMRALAAMNNNLEQAAAMLLSEETLAPQESQNNAVPDTKENTPELPSEMICVVCWDNSRNAIFLPCGHVCTCWECATSVQKSGQCPICRIDIQSTWKVYYS
jgi:E3 ubiquitin-protein ligase XIAP/baculoviral IAP repeat-containing protein 2/3